VAAGNAELAERKRQMKLAEVQEAAEIAEYIRQRDARDQVCAGNLLRYGLALPASPCLPVSVCLK
jgi:hypothetical protein